MVVKVTRRGVIGGIAAVAGNAAFARAPETSVRPRARGFDDAVVPAAPKKLVSQSEYLIQKAGLGGDVGFAVTDVQTGDVIEARLGTTFMPPASTLKAVTALYALDRLGANYRFSTSVYATGPLRNGRIEGDLILGGGGDPTLDTDRLADLAVLLREAGVREISGDFLLWAGVLPQAERIDADQPEHVSYNPAYGGLNLNFNRVHFEWKRAQDDYEITMQARALRFRPSTSVSSMTIVDRQSPVFDHWNNGRRDHWSVARRALGRDGARWLPVRYPALYAGDVFRTLARSNGIVLPPAKMAHTAPTGTLLAEIESPDLQPILQGMLKYSTNLTAEIAGLTASAQAYPVTSLTRSAKRMAHFAADGTAGRAVFRDHSGLGYGSAISPQAMAAIIAKNADIAPLLKTFSLNMGKEKPAPEGVEVYAKTGTLNFVSSLAGIVETRSGRKLSFAFFSADTERRDAIPPAERERPPGAKGWSRRSRNLQRELLRNWAEAYA